MPRFIGRPRLFEPKAGADFGATILRALGSGLEQGIDLGRALKKEKREGQLKKDLQNQKLVTDLATDLIKEGRLSPARPGPVTIGQAPSTQQVPGAGFLPPAAGTQRFSSLLEAAGLKPTPASRKQDVSAPVVKQKKTVTVTPEMSKQAPGLVVGSEIDPTFLASYLRLSQSGAGAGAKDRIRLEAAKLAHRDLQTYQESAKLGLAEGPLPDFNQLTDRYEKILRGQAPPPRTRRSLSDIFIDSTLQNVR